MHTFATNVVGCLLLVSACSKSADSAPKSKLAEASAAQKPSAATATPTPAPQPPRAPAAEPVACDAKAIEALANTLNKANGLNVERGDPAVEAEIDAAKARILGEAFAFTGCTFSMQGNDEVTFGATGTDAELGCIMKDGEAGVRAFREEAMTLDPQKLRLDVRGEIAAAGMLDRLQMTKCVINVHE